MFMQTLPVHNVSVRAARFCRPRHEPKPEFDTKTVLELAVAVYKDQGFIKSGAGGTERYDDKGDLLPEDKWVITEDNKTRIHKHLTGAATLTVTKDDKEFAEEIHAHFMGLTFKKLAGKTNDFENTALKHLENDLLDRLGVAIVASLPKSVDRAKLQDELKEKTEDSVYVGKLGKRCQFTVEVNDIRFVEKFGIHLVTTIESDKNVLKFFYANSPASNGIEVGKTINIAAFVKGQDVSKYSGVKETMVNRVKVNDV
jgi:hypothetical protein